MGRKPTSGQGKSSFLYQLRTCHSSSGRTIKPYLPCSKIGFIVIGQISSISDDTLAYKTKDFSPFLTFLKIPPDWQIGAQGAILIIVLAFRALIDRAEARK